MNEEAVQRTANDAARAKASISQLGYYQDNFVKQFLRKAGGRSVRCSPLINRGYYARHKAISSLVRLFIEHCNKAEIDSQVIIFGGGNDTMYYCLKEEQTLNYQSASRFIPTRYVELDLIENSIHKVQTILQSKKLCTLLEINEDERNQLLIKKELGELHTTGGYHVLPCDLRSVKELSTIIKKCNLLPVSYFMFGMHSFDRLSSVCYCAICATFRCASTSFCFVIVDHANFGYF